MKHPFISDLSDKNLEELQSIITGLNTKLSFAYRTQNSPMIHQLHMALESYREEYNRKMDELTKKSNIHTKIDISKKEG